MRPFSIAGEVWEPLLVAGRDPRLVDRTGEARLATTDPETRRVYISDEVAPPLLDRVVLHEAAHAVAVSRGLLAPMRAAVPPPLWVPLEEWAASMVEGHAIEAVAAASEALGRPVCVDGSCASVI